MEVMHISTSSIMYYYDLTLFYIDRIAIKKKISLSGPL